MKERGPLLTEHGQRSHAGVLPTSGGETARANFQLSPLAVLPSQFFRPALSYEKGEVALMYAVLEDAVRCFAQQFVEHRVRTQRLAEEAEEWFLADDEHWPFSFVNICAALGLNPQYLRRGLEQWRQQHPAKLRQLRPQVVHRSPCLSTVA
jgi:hypothetical protein